MLANMTNSQTEDWNASPRMRNQTPSPTMQGSGFHHYPSFRRVLFTLLLLPSSCHASAPQRHDGQGVSGTGPHCLQSIVFAHMCLLLAVRLPVCSTSVLRCPKQTWLFSAIY